MGLKERLEELNKDQYQAVTTDSKYVRIIAGAGSGKTRVLTYRIIYLIEEFNASPFSILGITFTNKAAKEIKQRIANLLPDVTGLQLSTIHSFCARFLRKHYKLIGYPSSFSIIDDEDQLSIMKELFTNDNKLKTDPKIKHVLNWIGAFKTDGFQYDDIKDRNFNPEEKIFLEYFRRYEEILISRYSLDFDDLLLKTIEILSNHPEVRETYFRYIKHILVDEFQDINDTQFRLIKLLMNENTTLYVVGDPDQTIYTWRGANNKIMLKLDQYLKSDGYFTNMETITLKENYRSTQTILDAANRLIDFNKDRIKKDLFSSIPNGDKITFLNSRSIKEEATFIASTILELKENKGAQLKDIAVLYRANYLTRELETTLGLYKIKYKVFGGQKFYQRKEIKDIISYFSLIVNPADETALNRIINIPRRGLGGILLARLKDEAEQASQPLFHYLKENLEAIKLPSKAYESLKTMIESLEKLENEMNNKGQKQEFYLESLNRFEKAIGYFEYLAKSDDNAEERQNNVTELFVSVANFLSMENSEIEPTFAEFVNEAILQSSQDEVDTGDYVSLMTVHTAKGLEFENVFIFGLGDGIFPSMRAVSESKDGIEEERRLAYVAFTRAKKRLFLSSNQDYSYVLQTNTIPSRFLKEAGIEVKTIKRPEYFSKRQEVENQYRSSFITRSKEDAKPVISTNGINDWKVGDRMSHIKWGEGTVLEEINGVIVVQFDQEAFGKKTLIGSHTAISRIGGTKND